MTICIVVLTNNNNNGDKGAEFKCYKCYKCYKCNATSARRYKRDYTCNPRRAQACVKARSQKTLIATPDAALQSQLRNR